MENAFFSSSTVQPSPLNFFLLRFHAQCPSGFSGMKQRDSWTLHIYLLLEIYVSQEEIGYPYYIFVQGTTFVLQKKIEPRQGLLEAISAGSGVNEVIDDLVSLKKKEEKGYDETLEGEWQLVWASQPEGQKREATVANGLKGMQIVKKNGRLENLNDFSPGFRYHASGDLIKTMCQWTQDMLLLADLNFPSTSKENIHWRCYTLTTRLGYQAAVRTGRTKN